MITLGTSHVANAASDLAKLSDGDKYESLAWPQLKKEFLKPHLKSLVRTIKRQNK